MKNYITNKILSSFTALTLLIAVSVMPGLASAAGASISLTSSKSTVAAGATVIIGVYMNGGGSAINAVQADLSYPASKLQYVGFSSSGSAFEIGAASGGGDGTATIARGSVSTVSGSGLVGTVTFRALAVSGSAVIGVAGSSSLVSDGNAVAYGSSGVSVNFGVAPASSGTTATPAASAPPKDTTAPVIIDIRVKDLTPFSAVIIWITNEASDSAVDYGLDGNYGLSTSASPAVTAHSVTLNSAFLTPETVFHYRVKSTDGAGNVATGTDKTLQLPGVPVTVIVRGADGKPQAGASVTLDGATGITNNKGSVTLPSSLGNKKITTTFDGVTMQKPITVSKNAKPLPPYQLDLSKKPLNHWMLTSLGLLVIVLTLLGIDAALFGSRLLARLAGIHLIPHGLHHALGNAAAGPALQPIEPTGIQSPNITSVSPPVEMPVEARVDEMLAVAKITPEPSLETIPKPESPHIALQTPITSVNDIKLDQSPPSTPSVQKISITDGPSLPIIPPVTPPKVPTTKPHHHRKTKTAPKLPK